MNSILTIQDESSDDEVTKQAQLRNEITQQIDIHSTKQGLAGGLVTRLPDKSIKDLMALKWPFKVSRPFAIVSYIESHDKDEPDAMRILSTCKTYTEACRQSEIARSQDFGFINLHILHYAPTSGNAWFSVPPPSGEDENIAVDSVFEQHVASYKQQESRVLLRSNSCEIKEGAFFSMCDESLRLIMRRRLLDFRQKMNSQEWTVEERKTVDKILADKFMTTVEPITKTNEIAVVAAAEAQALKQMLIQSAKDPLSVPSARPLVASELDNKDKVVECWKGYSPLKTDAKSNLSFVE